MVHGRAGFSEGMSAQHEVPAFGWLTLYAGLQEEHVENRLELGQEDKDAQQDTVAAPGMNQSHNPTPPSLMPSDDELENLTSFLPREPQQVLVLVVM